MTFSYMPYWKAADAKVEGAEGGHARVYPVLEAPYPDAGHVPQRWHRRLSGHRRPRPYARGAPARERSQQIAVGHGRQRAEDGGGKGADLRHPQISSLASPHRPKASDGSLEPRRREYL